MNFAQSFKERVQFINEDNFEESALSLFEYQYSTNNIFNSYCKKLGKKLQGVQNIDDIPFLPIEFFKDHEIKSGKWKTEMIFKSSGTTGTNRSTHYIRDSNFYRNISRSLFEQFFGPLPDLQLFALLPSYEEQGDSSLIHMVDHLIGNAAAGSGFFHGKAGLVENLEHRSKQKKVLFGVSFALLNLVENRSIKSRNLQVIETGGMKGRRKEITRMELHQRLSTGFSLEKVCSEYGMTELLSQAYSMADGQFKFPRWAKVIIRDINDPFSRVEETKTGGINVIDLANIDSCAFIETKDLGKVLKNGSFEILGRYDNSDIRGCNLMI